MKIMLLKVIFLCLISNQYTYAQKIKMVKVKGGTFTMGCTAEQGENCWDNEKPTQQVTLENFEIGKYEVTQAQWKAVMGENPSFNSNCDECPVENVDWNLVQVFIQKLNAKTKKNYRLPTEAEWEFAARGGTLSKGYKYSGSNDLNAVAWYDANSEKKSQKVGTKAPNELGIFDMCGNVDEWCSDWSARFNGNPQNNPKGPDNGEERILRGGSYEHDMDNCRNSLRESSNPDYEMPNHGFRLFRSAK